MRRRNSRLWNAVALSGLGVFATARSALAQTFEPTLSYAVLYHDLNDQTPTNNSHEVTYSASNLISNNTAPAFSNKWTGNSSTDSINNNANTGNSQAYGGISAVTNSENLSFEVPVGSGVVQTGSVPPSGPAEPSALYTYVELVWDLSSVFPAVGNPLVTYQFNFGGTVGSGGSAAQFGSFNYRYYANLPAESSPMTVFPSSVPVTSTGVLPPPTVPQASQGSGTNLGSSSFAQYTNQVGNFNLSSSGVVNLASSVPAGKYFVMTGYLGYQALDPGGPTSAGLTGNPANLVSLETGIQFTGAGDGVNFNNPANWAGGVVPQGQSQFAEFTGAGGVIALNGNQSVAGLIFNTPGSSYTITPGSNPNNTLTINGGSSASLIEDDGGTHTITAPIDLNSTATAVVTNNTDQLILAGNLTGTGGFGMSGAGALMLSGTNSYTGGTQILSGTVHAGSSSALGSSTNPLMLVGGKLDLNGNTISVGQIYGTGTVDNLSPSAPAILMVGTDGSNSTFNGTLASTDTALTLNKVGAGTLTLGASNSFTGGTTISQGAISISSDNNLGATAGTVVLGGGTLQANTSLTLDSNRAIVVHSNSGLDVLAGQTLTYAGDITGGGNLTTTASGGTAIFSGANSYGGTTTIAGGELQLGTGGTLGAGSVTDNAVLALNSTGDTTLSNSITGSGSVMQMGAGTTTLSGNNSYSGDTDVLAGLLQINGTVGGANLNVASGATATISGQAQSTNINVNSGASLNLGAAGVIPSSSSITNNGTFTLNNSLTVNSLGGSGAVQLNGITLTLDGGSYAGSITGTGGVTLAGSATLTGSNSYDGTTTINAGVNLELSSGSTPPGDLVNDGAITYDYASPATVSSSISGSGAQSQIGGGEVFLTGTNSGSGSITVGGGGVAFIGQSSLGSGYVFVSAGAIAGFASGVTSTSFTTDSAGLLTNLGASDIGAAGLVVNATGTFTALATISGSSITPYTYSAGQQLSSGAIPSSASENLEFTNASATVFSLTTSTATFVNTLLTDTVTAGSSSTSGTVQINIGSGETLIMGAASGVGGFFVTAGGSATTNADLLTIDNGGNAALTAGTSSSGELIFAVNGGSTSPQLVDNVPITDNFGGLPVSVVKTGTGSMFIAAASSYSGGTFVDQGLLQGNNATAFGTGPVTIASGATVYLGGPLRTYANNFSLWPGVGAFQNFGAINFQGTGGGDVLSGNLTLLGPPTTSPGSGDRISQTASASTVTISGSIAGPGTLELFANPSTSSNTFVVSNSSNNWTGGLIVDNAATAASNTIVKLAANDAIPSGLGLGDVFLNNSSTTAGVFVTLDLDGLSQSINGLNGTTATLVTNNGAANASITVGANSNSATFSGSITDGISQLSFIKVGAGTQTLTNTSTYSGATDVFVGTLLLASGADLADTSSVLVKPGANLTVQTGASINPNATLIINGTLNLESGLGGLSFPGAKGSSGLYNIIPLNGILDVTGLLNLAGGTPIVHVLNGTTAGLINLNGANLTINAGGSFPGAIGNGSSTGGVTIGGGTVTLAGSNSYSGTTSISGALIVTGSINTSASVMINSGGALSGNGNASSTGMVGNVTLQSGSEIMPGVSPTDNNVGYITAANLNVPGGDMRLDIDSLGNDVVYVDGTATYSGSSTITIPTPALAPPGGTYVLVQANSPINFGVGNMYEPTLSAPNSTRYSYSLDFSNPDQIQADVTFTPANLTWAGTMNANSWDTQASQSWTNQSNASSDYFFAGDNVTFNDSNSPTYDVAIASAGVSPTSITVSTVNAYTFSGGPISGATALTITSGTLNLQNSNTYTGTTTINSAGTLNLAAAGALPVGGTVVNNGNLIASATNYAASINGSGTLTITNNSTFALMGINVSTISSLAIGSSSTLDIGNAPLVINYTGPNPEASIQQLIENGQNNTPSSAAIISSFVTFNSGFGLAYAAYGDIALNDPNLLPGQLIIEPDVLGDTDLNGSVNIHDLQTLLSNFNQPGFWDEGNFTGHANIDISDLQALLTNFNTTTILTYAQLSSIQNLLGQFGEIATANPNGAGFTLTSVPEPATLALTSIGLSTLLRRRRRTHA
jgi:fibronectin-binding autotransporter adhesin